MLVRPHVSDRGLSRNLWNLARLNEIQSDPSLGYYFFDDFLWLPEGKYTGTQATAGTFNLIAGDGGIVEADSNSTTDTQGIQAQLGGDAAGTSAGIAMVTCEARTEVRFECRVKLHDFGAAGAGIQFFVGLSEVDTTLIATSANSSANHIGFEGIATNTLIGVGEKAGARGTVSGLVTVVDSDVTADSWVNLGFLVDGLDSISFFVNGVKNATTLAAANIPIVGMTPSIVCQSDGATTDPLVRMDWWAFSKSLRIG